MRKLSLLFVGVLVSLFLLLPSNVKADTNYENVGRPGTDTAFTSINTSMYNSFAGDNYFGLEGYYVKYLRNGNTIWPVYCSEVTVEYNAFSDYVDSGNSDIGIQYIIKNGFQADKNGESYHFSKHEGCSADSCPAVAGIKTNYPKNNQPWYVNYWLTQVAIWVYSERGLWNEPEVTALKNRLATATNLTENERIIKELVDGANNIKTEATNFINIDPDFDNVTNTNLTLDGDYYYSQLISVKGTGKTYTVSTNKTKFKVVDANKAEKTTFNSGDKFYIRVAKGDITSSEEVSVTIKSKGNYYAKAYRRQYGQNIEGYELTDSQEKEKSKTFSISYTKNCDVTVKIIDSETKEQICGGSVIIQDKDGKEVATMTFTEENCTQTVSLPDGNYKAVQKEAPASYIKDDKTYEIDTKTKCPVEIEIPNTRLYKIRILKTIQGTENPVEGAKLKLEDSNGKTILEFVSSTEPTVINSLYAGTYYLSEIEAPNGYALKTDKMEIQVNASTNDKLFMFPNDEIVVPITDFNSNLLWISLALCLLGAGLIFYSKKRLKSVA